MGWALLPTLTVRFFSPCGLPSKRAPPRAHSCSSVTPSGGDWSETAELAPLVTSLAARVLVPWWQTSTMTTCCRGSTKVSGPTVSPALTTTFWSAAVSWPGTPVVSTTQYRPGTTSVMVQLPSAPVVQVLPVLVSSAPCGGSPPSGGLSLNRVNTAPASGLPASSCLWTVMVPRWRLV